MKNETDHRIHFENMILKVANDGHERGSFFLDPNEETIEAFTVGPDDPPPPPRP